MEIVQAVKNLNSISRERLNFRRRPILCTTLYRNLMQASNFGGIFDQLFLWICLWNFHRRRLSTFSIPQCKKVKNDQNSNQEVSCLNCDPDWIQSAIFLLFSFSILTPLRKFRTHQSSSRSQRWSSLRSRWGSGELDTYKEKREFSKRRFPAGFISSLYRNKSQSFYSRLFCTLMIENLWRLTRIGDEVDLGNV